MINNAAVNSVKGSIVSSRSKIAANVYALQEIASMIIPTAKNKVPIKKFFCAKPAASRASPQSAFTPINRDIKKPIASQKNMSAKTWLEQTNNKTEKVKPKLKNVNFVWNLNPLR